MATDRARRDAVLIRAMGAFFLIGSLCFVAGPLNAYDDAVGAHADAMTFFIGSIRERITWTHHSSRNAPAQSTER